MQYSSCLKRLLSMHLEASIHIRRSPRNVWAFLGDVSNVARWDRGVSRSEPASSTPDGVGFEFHTYAHPRVNSRGGEWGKMSYRITSVDPIRGCTIQLTSTAGNARYFKSAEWRFRIEGEHGGSRLFCVACFVLKWQYLLLAPILFSMEKVICTDLECLKAKLEIPVPDTGSPPESALV